MKKGIWRYDYTYKQRIEDRYMISVGEGNTPFESIPALAGEIDVQNIYLKREDMNPSGSHKDRYIAYSLAAHIQNILKKDASTKNIHFVISSSGNAAISALRFFKLNLGRLNIKLDMFLSNKIDVSKLARLIKELPEAEKTLRDRRNYQDNVFKISFCATPLAESIRQANRTGAVLLRGSTDEYGTEGYKSISYEIFDESNSTGNFPDAIFIPCSSGSTVVGIYEGFQQIVAAGGDIKMPKFYILQTTEVNTIARYYDKSSYSSETSIAEAIVDKVAHRMEQVRRVIDNTSGGAFILRNEEILRAQKMLEKHGIFTSCEGAMTLAGIIRTKETGLCVNNPACIMTGIR